MFKVDSYTQIGDWEFDHCVELDITSSIDSLTDTCRITIERKLTWQGKEIALGDDPIFKTKDPVLIKFGYDGELITEFIGYIKNIKSGVPVVLECEDSMMLLKKGVFTKAYSSVTLKQLLTDMLPAGLRFIAADMNLGAQRISKATPAKVLEDLRKLGIYAYFRIINNSPVLYCGLPYWTDNRGEASFTFGEDIIDPNNLVYKVADDVSLRVKAIGLQKDNKKIEVEVGDPDGELRTVYLNDVNVNDLKTFALAQLKRFQYTGYYGDFTVLGSPSMQKGDIVNLVGNKYHPDTRHLISKVTKHCGVTKGIKQVIEPREIISNGI